MRLAKSEQDLLVMEAIGSASQGMSGWLRANCPFCVLAGEGSPDTKQSWGFHEASGKWHCFRCRSRGKLGDYDGELEEPEDAGPIEFIEPPEGFVELASPDGRRAMVLEQARRYVLSRGLSWQTIEEARVGACYKGRYAGRIVVPVTNVAGTGWLGFFARVWLDKAALMAAEAEAEAEGRKPPKRYLTADGEWRKTCLFNQRALYEETDEPVGAFEGGFSGFNVWPHCTGFLGKPTPEQLALLLDAKRPVALCLDGDAWEEGEALSLWLRCQGKRAGYVHFPPKMDGNDMPAEWTRQQMRECIKDPIG